MKHFLLLFLLVSLSVKAQYTIITPGNGQPNINANSPNSQGIIIPTLTTTQRDQILGPQTGTIIFNTTCACLNYYNGSWVRLSANNYNDEYAPPNPFITKTLGWDYHSANPGTDEANAIALITPNSTSSEYYITGKAWELSPLAQSGIEGYFLAKYTDSPWERKVSNAVGYDVAVDGDGNVYTTGTFSGTAVFGAGNTLTSDGDTDVFLAKYDTNGNLQWVRKSGGSGNDLGRAISISGSNVLLTGYFKNNNFTLQSPTNNVSLNSAGGKDIFIAKYDTNGNLVWARQAGGTNDDEAKDINADYEITIVGYFTGTATFGSGFYNSNGGKDIFLAKYDNNGTFQRAFTAGGTGDDVANAINVDNFITGYFSNTLTMVSMLSATKSVNSFGGKDMFLAHIMNDYIDYNKLVARVLVRGGGINDDEGMKVVRSGDRGSNGLIAVAGNFSGNADFGGPFLITNTISGFIATFSWDGHYDWGKALSKTSTSYASDIAITAYSRKPYIVGVYDNYLNAGTRPWPATMKLWTTE